MKATVTNGFTSHWLRSTSKKGAPQRMEPASQVGCTWAECVNAMCHVPLPQQPLQLTSGGHWMRRPTLLQICSLPKAPCWQPQVLEAIPGVRGPAHRWKQLCLTAQPARAKALIASGRYKRRLRPSFPREICLHLGWDGAHIFAKCQMHA